MALLAQPYCRISSRSVLRNAVILSRSSHIGSNPIKLPDQVSVSPAFPCLVTGPRGSLTLSPPTYVHFKPAQDGHLSVSVDSPDVKVQRASWGLWRSLLANAIKGVSEGHVLPIALKGVGYRATLENGPNARQTLSLKLGYPNPVLKPIPDGVECVLSAPTEIVLKGSDKQVIGQFAAQIRAIRKPEPYNGKGIFVGNETIKRKEVKKK